MNATVNLTRAAQLHASGDVLSARREAEAALAADPQNLIALRFVGVLYCQSGDPGRGADFLQQAVARDPADLQTRLNLVQALLDAGQPAEAEQVAAAASGPLSPQLLRVRAAVARELGKPMEAVALLERAVAHAPADWACWNNFGNALLDADQPDRAIKALERAKSLNPGSALVHINLGRALEAAARHSESCAAFDKAAQLDPADGVAAFEHGKALLRLGRAEEALAALSNAARIQRTDPSTYVTIGLTHERLNQLKPAEQAFRIALHVDPGHGPAYLNLAILLERANRVEELEALHQDALANGVSSGETGYMQALTLRRKGALEEALLLAQQSAPPSLDPAWRWQFIGEVADKLGDADTAFAAFAEMNRLTGSYPDALHLDRTEYSRVIERLIATTTREWFDSWTTADVVAEPPSPAFLLGFLRSGTTLLDTILMGHADADVFEEDVMLAKVDEAVGDRDQLARLTPAEVQQLRDRYFAELSRPAEPGKLLIDKNPLAILRAPVIHRLFPDARIIFAIRHPCDVVLSCFMQNFQVSPSMASFLDLENAARTYDRAMTLWKKSREIFPLSVHAVRYEDLVADLEGEMRPLLDYLGLEWDDGILDHQTTAVERGYIRTPSYAQVTERIYSRASGRWTRYRQHMSHVLPILAPWVEEFGYSLD